MLNRMTKPEACDRITLQEILTYKSPKRISLSGKRVTAAAPVFEIQEVVETQFSDLAKNLYDMFNSL